MNTRGPYGPRQQPSPTAPQGPPSRDQPQTSWFNQPVRRRAAPDPGPSRNRPSAPADQQQPRGSTRKLTGNVTSTVPAALAPAPPPARRGHRNPGAVALDNLEDQHENVPAKLNWRDVFHRLTGIDLGPSKDQAYELRLRDRVRAPLGSAFPIAVVNLKGGVGKTAVVEALGSTFADARDDRVIALDLDAGNLADRHGRRSPLSMADLLADKSVARYLDVRAHTYMNGSRLEVLTVPDYATHDRPIERDDFARVFSILRKHYAVVLLDCGTALKSQTMEAALLESRALVVVTSASIDAIRKTGTTLEWLLNNGYQHLLDSAALVINHTERGKPNGLLDKEIEKLSGQLRSGCVVQLPFDRHVHEGKEIALERLSKKSRRRYLQLATVLAGMFPKRDIGNIGAAQRN